MSSHKQKQLLHLTNQRVQASAAILIKKYAVEDVSTPAKRAKPDVSTPDDVEVGAETPVINDMNVKFEGFLQFMETIER